MPSQTRQPATPAPVVAAPTEEVAGPAAGTSNAEVAASIATGAPAAGASGTPAGKPAWASSSKDVTAIQTELARLKLYTKRIDGLYGNGTQTGLTSAYGGDGWRTVDVPGILAKLKGMGGAAPAAPAGDKPAWATSSKEVTAVQTELARLGLYRARIDGVFGNGSQSGLVEAFGGDSWKTKDVAAILTELKAAKTPTGDDAKQKFKYGEMFKDGVLDITLGVGFDEGGAHLAAIDAFSAVLEEHGFGVNNGLAQKLYQAAGRKQDAGDFGMFFVRENALSFKPPAGPERKVHAVVRLVSNQSGDEGGEAAGAFKEGMAESDVAYYSGHGRYGSGPDFDRNMAFDLLDANGKIEQHIDDYEVLEKLLKAEGKAAGRDAWAQFQWRVSKKRIDVDGSNEGNVFLNPESLHGNEFGGKLMYWNLQQSGGKGGELQTGAAGPMAKAQAENPEHRYSVLVFDGCRTQDYVKSIRSTPGLDAKGADVLATKRTLNWGDEAATLGTFLDGILAKQSAGAVIGAMDAKQSPANAGGQQGGAYAGF